MVPSVEIDAKPAREELLTRLRRANDALRHGARAVTWRTGLERAGRALLVLAGAHLLYRACLWVIGGPETTPAVVLAVSAATLLAAMASAWVTAARWRPDLMQTADRLDLAGATRNRVAAALEFSSVETSPFEQAAILDGLAELKRCEGTTPWLERHPARAPASALRIVAGILLLLAALVVPVGSFGLLDAAEDPVSGSAAEVADAGTGAVAPDTQDGATKRRSVARAGAVMDSAAQADSGSQGGSGKPSQGARPDPAVGQPRRGKSSGSRESRQASRGRGDPTEGGSADQPHKKERSPSKKTLGKPQKSKVVGKRREEKQGQGATVGQASSGGGSMSPVKSPWSQRDRSTDEPLPENPTEDEVDDEASEREARGGAQPTLKDRRGSPSRDLSISAPGEGGEGRGGPTPPKKSRGTASLVMGLPVPDFVRGLLNPGTTKVTHEKVQPVPFPAAPRAREGAAATRPEPRVRATPIPATWRPIVRKFLIALHEAGDRAATGTKEQ